MSKNCYISNACVLNLNIFYRLLINGFVSWYDYDIPKARFIRYMSNIRYMLDEFHIYHFTIEFDPVNQVYRLLCSL